MGLDNRVESRLGNKSYRNQRFNAQRQSYQQEKEKELLFTPRISRAAQLTGRKTKDFEQDNSRLLNQKGAYERNLQARPKVQGFQIGSTSDMVMNERFESDFQRTIEAMSLSEDAMINFEGLLTLYQYLGFIKNVEAETAMLQEVFDHLQGDNEQPIIPLSYAVKFARCIQNFHHQDVVDTRRQGAQVNKNQLGKVYDDVGILYKPSEIEYISKKYRALYANRIDQIMHEKTENKKMKSI